MAVLASAVVREKSPEAFRTISEVATDLDVPQHVLRFWESRFSQVRPIKRAGGRRYYRPEDIDLLRGIRALLYREGFTIKGAQKVMRDKGLRYVSDLGRAVKVTPVVTFAPVVETPTEEPRHARAVLAVVERAHMVAPEEPIALDAEDADVEEDVAGETKADMLASEENLKLEQLLAELLQMKTRLRAAMPRHAG
jgi:DNA-binding transcriptional MerR regulator